MGPVCSYKKIKNTIKCDSYFIEIEQFINSNLRGHQRISLNFKNGNLNQENASKVATALSTCKNLKTLILDIDGNKICFGSIAALSSGLEQCFNLQTLIMDVEDCSIGDEGLVKISQSLEKCSAISYFKLFL
ncbi:hypothetical protein ABPG73_016929, partial [Tetrahymena malaccensis]